MPRTRIKVCGLRDEETAFAAVEAGADALGFVFAAGSPRLIDPDDAGDIALSLPPFVTSVALFAGVKEKRIAETIEEHPYFDMIQLHGDEAEPTVRACGDLGMDLIKAIRFNENTEAELHRWNRFEELDAILVDGSAGGAGEPFDWEAFAEVAEASDHPIIIAGGLTPENVGEAITVIRPYGVDVSSGVEHTRGVKDVGLIAEFCAAVQEVDRSFDE
ncbi:MAG: phosphoribosylanthranilate isomerase [Planctomycetota bacterium]